MSVINNNLYNTAVAGYTPINGMYAFYGTPITVPAGATVEQIVTSVNTTTGAGLIRCPGLTSSLASDATLTDKGAVVSGSISYIGTTANAEIIAGVDPTPGTKINAIGVASIYPNIYGVNGMLKSSGFLKDKLLDSSTVSGGIVFPAGGYVILVDTITVSSGATS